MTMVIYFLIAIAATTAGSIAGIGGGIIIKPLLDILGDYGVRTVSVLSSLTVLAMSIVSVSKQIYGKAPVDYRIALPLALGGAVGGIAGQQIFSAVVIALNAGRTVTVIQNSILFVLIVAVFIYMKNRSKIKSPELKGVVPSLLTGLLLGMISSFLGIGGGPINVALIIYLFAFDIKAATVSSLVIILFSQIASVGLTAAAGGLSGHDLSMLPEMVVGAVAGGFIGSSINKKVSDKAVEVCFNVIQVIVLVIVVFNVVRNVL